jgi:hypothetical protein
MSKLHPTKENWQKVCNETSLIQKPQDIRLGYNHVLMKFWYNVGGDIVFLTYIMKFCNVEALKI